MAETLILLRLEHGTLSKLLGLIVDQVAAAGGGMRMDEALLRMAAEYFSDYPDRCHHPKEDLVYQRLRMRDPNACVGIRDLISDHRRLHELTEAFANAVRRLGEEPQAVEPAARAAMLEFAAHYRQHLREEEERFFRMAEARLTPEDWDALDFAVCERDDPLFDHVAERRFAALRDRIETLAEQGKAQRSVFEAAKELRALSGIEHFNEWMNSVGQRFRLTRFTEGGYALELDRKLLLYIPECSAERAAWCAYCYLCGQGLALGPVALVGECIAASDGSGGPDRRQRAGAVPSSQSVAWLAERPVCGCAGVRRGNGTLH